MVATEWDKPGAIKLSSDFETTVIAVLSGLVAYLASRLWVAERRLKLVGDPKRLEMLEWEYRNRADLLRDRLAIRTRQLEKEHAEREREAWIEKEEWKEKMTSELYAAIMGQAERGLLGPNAKPPTRDDSPSD